MGSIGVLGTDDDQEQNAWDAQGLLWSLTTPQTTAVQSPIFDCSRFGFLLVHGIVAVNAVTLTAVYSADKAGAQVTGVRGFTLDPNVANAAQWSQVNQGPYVSLQTQLVTAPNNYTPTIRAILSNRPHPLVMYPRSNHVLVRHTQTIPAGASVTYHADSYFSGSVGVYLQGGTQGYSIVAQSIAETSGYTPFWDGAVAANASIYPQLIWPMDGSAFVVTNASAVNDCTGVQVIVVANLSGV